MRYKRNEDLYTSKEQIIQNILTGIQKTTYTSGTRMSGLGYLGYPDYDFKRPQGAAFAVGKIARELIWEKRLVGVGRYSGEYYITEKGKRFVTHNYHKE